jgi:hypothetical protein
MKPSLGRIVHYKLTGQDADAINRRRDDFTAYQRLHFPDPATRPNAGADGATGHAAHVGNRAEAGQVYPAIVVRCFNPSVNLQVILDGTDTYWATSRVEGDDEGYWAWPPRI